MTLEQQKALALARARVNSVQPEQNAAALRDAVNPTSLFKGVNPDHIDRISSIIGNEEESKMRVASYMSKSQNVPFKVVLDEYDAFAAQSGFEGNNGTAHYTQLVNKLGKQWQHIKKTEEVIGAEGFKGTLLQKAIPDLRTNIELISKPNKIKSYLQQAKDGAEQTVYGSWFAGVNRLVGGIVGIKDRHFKKPFEENAEFWDQYAEKRQMDSKVPPEIQDSTSGKIAAGIGALPVWGVMATTGGVGTLSMTSSMYSEGVDFYRNAIPEEDRSADEEFLFSMTYGVLATKLEKIGFGKMLKPLFNTGKKLSLKQIVNRSTEFAVGAGTETGTELLQQMLLNAEMLAIDPDAAAFGSVFELENLIVTSAVASFGSGVTTSVGVSKDIAAGFYPNPLTTDGHAPTASFIRKMVEREGLDAVKERFDDSDPRKELIDDLVSDNADVQVAAEAKMEELTAPNPDGRALDMDEVLGTKEETEATYQSILEARELDEATIPKEEDVLSQPLFSEEEASAIDEMLVEESKDDAVTAEEAKLFEAELQEELAGTKDEDVFAEDIIEMSGPIDPDLSQADQAAADAELRRMLGVSRNTPEEQKLLNAWKAVVKAEEKGAKAKRGEQVKTETLRKKLEAKADALKQDIQAIKAKGKADVAAARVKASERLVAQRIKAKEQKGKELNKLRESNAKRVAALKSKIKEIKDLGMGEKRDRERATWELKQLVDQFPKEVKSQMLPYFVRMGKTKNVQKQAEILDNALMKLSELTDTLYRKNAQSKLSKVVRRGIKRQKGDLAYDEFQKIAQFAKMSREEAETRSEILRNKPKPSESDIMEMFLLDVFGGTLNPSESVGFTAAQIEAAQKDAEYMLSNGKLRSLEAKKKQDIEDKRVLDGAIDNVQGSEARQTLHDMTASEKKRMKKAANSIKAFTVESLNSMAHLLDVLARKGAVQMTFLHKELFTPLTKATSQFTVNVSKAIRKFESGLHEILGEDTGKIMREWEQYVDNDVRITLQGKKGPHKMTTWQGIRLLMQTWEEGNTSNLLGMLEYEAKPKRGLKSDEEYQAEVAAWEAGADARINALREQLVEFVEEDGVAAARMMQDLFRESGVRHVEAVRAIDGKTPNIVKNYAGQRRTIRDSKSEIDVENMTAEEHLMHSGKTASWKERSSNNHELVLEDAHKVYIAHVFQMEHSYALAPWAKKIRKVLDDAEFQRAAQQSTGSRDVLNLIRRQADIIARGRQKTDVLDKHWNAVTKFVHGMKLVLNIPSALKQPASLFAYFDVPGMKFSDYAKYAAIGMNRKGYWKSVKALMDTPYMQNRYMFGMDVALNNIMSRGPSDIVTGNKDIIDSGLVATKAMDALTIMVGGKPVYDWAYDQEFNKSGDHLKAKEAAEIAFAEASNNAQQASGAQDLGYIQSAGPVMKMFTAFQTSPIQYQRNINTAFRAAKRGRISWKAFAKTFFIYHIVLPQIFSAMGGAIAMALGKDIDLEEWRKRQTWALTGNISIVPLAGVAVEQFMNKILQLAYPDPNITVFETINKASGGLARIVRGVKDGDEEQINAGFEAMIDSAGYVPDQVQELLEEVEQFTGINIPLVDEED